MKITANDNQLSLWIRHCAKNFRCTTFILLNKPTAALLQTHCTSGEYALERASTSTQSPQLRTDRCGIRVWVSGVGKLKTLKFSSKLCVGIHVVHVVLGSGGGGRAVVSFCDFQWIIDSFLHRGGSSPVRIQTPRLTAAHRKSLS